MEEIRCPRLNANDDTVIISSFHFKDGDKVDYGQVLLVVESDKSTYELESPIQGYAYSCISREINSIECGKVIIKVSENKNDNLKTIEEFKIEGDMLEKDLTKDPTLKAKELIHKHNIDTNKIKSDGYRITVSDVHNYLENTKNLSHEDCSSNYDFRELNSYQKSTIDTVSWQKKHAVPAYVETLFDKADWLEYIKHISIQNNIIVTSPAPLILYRLAKLAVEQKLINSYIENDFIFTANTVNIGFTVSIGARLQLFTIGPSSSENEIKFVSHYNSLIRKIYKGEIHDSNSPPTIGFTTIDRYSVSRHIPLLAPKTSFMLAYSMNEINIVLGATYDHRVMHGEFAAYIINRVKNINHE